MAHEIPGLLTHQADPLKANVLEAHFSAGPTNLSRVSSDPDFDTRSPQTDLVSSEVFYLAQNLVGSQTAADRDHPSRAKTKPRPSSNPSLDHLPTQALLSSCRLLVPTSSGTWTAHLWLRDRRYQRCYPRTSSHISVTTRGTYLQLTGRSLFSIPGPSVTQQPDLSSSPSKRTSLNGFPSSQAWS